MGRVFAVAPRHHAWHQNRRRNMRDRRHSAQAGTYSRCRHISLARTYCAVAERRPPAGASEPGRHSAPRAIGWPTPGTVSGWKPSDPGISSGVNYPVGERASLQGHSRPDAQCCRTPAISLRVKRLLPGSEMVSGFAGAVSCQIEAKFIQAIARSDNSPDCRRRFITINSAGR